MTERDDKPTLGLHGEALARLIDFAKASNNIKYERTGQPDLGVVSGEPNVPVATKSDSKKMSTPPDSL